MGFCVANLEETEAESDSDGGKGLGSGSYGLFSFISLFNGYSWAFRRISFILRAGPPIFAAPAPALRDLTFSNGDFVPLVLPT